MADSENQDTLDNDLWWRYLGFEWQYPSRSFGSLVPTVCHRLPLFTFHPCSACIYPTFFWPTPLWLTFFYTPPLGLIFGSISVYTSPPLHFHSSPTPVSIHEITSIWAGSLGIRFQPTKLGYDRTNLLIYSLASDSFNSPSSTRNLIFHNFNYYILALQQFLYLISDF